MKSLPAGEYVLMYQMQGLEGDKNNKLVISCYSDWRMEFKPIDAGDYPSPAI